MNTTTEATYPQEIHTVTTAGTAPTMLSSATSTPFPTATTSTGIGQAQAGQSQTRGDPPLAQELADLNFYLRRVTLGGNGDMSQIDCYGGGPDYEMFLDAVGSVGIHYGWTEAQMLRTIEMKLKDKAREYYGALLPRERPTTMVEMRDWFRRVFERKLTLNAGKRELERCIRNPGEPLGEYAHRLKVVVNKMFPANSLAAGERHYHRNLLLVNQFVEGLEGRLANEVLRAGDFYNLNDCLAVAEQCEDIVSRMIPETRYDIRMSAIRRIEAEHEGGSNSGDGYQPTARKRYGDNEYGRDHQDSRREVPTGEVVPYTETQRQRATRPSTAVRPWNGTSNQAGRVPQRSSDANGELLRGQAPRHWEGTRQSQGNSRPEGNGNATGRQFRGSPFFGARFPYMRNRCRRCGQEGHFVLQCENPRRLFCFHCGKVGEVCSLNSQRTTRQRST